MAEKKRDGLSVVIRVLIALIIVTTILLISQMGIYYYRRWQLSQYPLEYSAEVGKYAAEYGLDEYLIYAIIKTESGFRTDAESAAGARGLMQIMDETFDWIKYRLDDGESAYDDMYGVESNIRYGCYLIYYNLEYFGDVECAIAAYHAGTARVTEWLGDDEYSADGKKLDIIPSSDTQHYVNKVNKAYQTYIKLYT